MNIGIIKKYVHILITLKRHLFNEIQVKELTLIKKFLTDSDICLDIGAHGGSWSKPLAELVKKGKVYSFEALPYYASILKTVFYLLGNKNIIVINKAVNETEGLVSVVWKNEAGKRLTGKTHIQSAQESSSYTIEVESVSLDNFIKSLHSGRIRFIKIDVEGMEIFVLKGACKLIAVHQPIIFCELDNRWTSRYGYSVNDVFDILNNHAYKAYLINSEIQLAAVNKETYRGKGDVLFVPSEMQIDY